MRQIWIAVHHDNDPKSAPPITLVTQMAATPPWVMGAAYPATHAFVIVKENDPDGLPADWRVDGKPPRATRGPWRLSPAFAPPTVAWSFPRLVQAQVDAGIAEAQRMVGEFYDFGEILAQGGAGAAALSAKFFPPAARFFNFIGAAIGRADPLHRASVCTRIATRVMQTMGVDTEWLPNLLPEVLAAYLAAGEKSGLTKRELSWVPDQRPLKGSV